MIIHRRNETTSPTNPPRNETRLELGHGSV